MAVLAKPSLRPETIETIISTASVRSIQYHNRFQQDNTQRGRDLFQRSHAALSAQIDCERPCLCSRARW